MMFAIGPCLSTIRPYLSQSALLSSPPSLLLRPTVHPRPLPPLHPLPHPFPLRLVVVVVVVVVVVAWMSLGSKLVSAVYFTMPVYSDNMFTGNVP